MPNIWAISYNAQLDQVGFTRAIKPLRYFVYIKGDTADS